jgi:hypothetical protein
MNGNSPVMKVARKLMTRGVNAESKPYIIDMIIANNMNKALMRSALPTFVDIAFTCIVTWSGFCFANIYQKVH